MNYQLVHPLLDNYGGPILLALFATFILMERRWPLRRWTGRFLRRAATNVAVSIPTLVAMRLALIPAVVGVGYWAQAEGFGLLRWMSLPEWLGAAIGFLWLDYSLYVWHWLNHRIPLLWRFHNVHHSDLDLSVTPALRFHFGEMLAGVIFRSAAVAIMGVTPLVVLAYESAFEAWVAFQHSNWRLPLRLERAMTWVFVTPRMHGIHHSILQRETNSNYSNLFSFWDRTHRTIRLNVRQQDIAIGVPGYRDAEEQTVRGLLTAPFRKQKPYWKKDDEAKPESREAGRRGSLPPGD